MVELSQNIEVEEVPQILWQSGSGVSLRVFSGEQARPYFDQIARLRMDIYREFPYLYDGSLDREKSYLEPYFNSENSQIFLVFDLDKVVGFSNCLPLREESDWLVKPFEKHDLNPKDILYMSEITLKSPYRRKGIVRKIFEYIEAEARGEGYSKIVFPTVKRDSAHALYPPEYLSHDGMWHHFGYEAISGFDIIFIWNQIDTKQEEPNRMQIWSKTL